VSRPIQSYGSVIRCTESKYCLHLLFALSYVPFLSTQTSSSGLKTRNFSTIISELTSCLRVHAEYGSKLNGVSLEFTGELNEDGFSVTECLGGSMELSEGELSLRYQVRSVMKGGVVLICLGS